MLKLNTENRNNKQDARCSPNAWRQTKKLCVVDKDRPRMADRISRRSIGSMYQKTSHDRNRNRNWKMRKSENTANIAISIRTCIHIRWVRLSTSRTLTVPYGYQAIGINWESTGLEDSWQGHGRFRRWMCQRNEYNTIERKHVRFSVVKLTNEPKHSLNCLNILCS